MKTWGEPRASVALLAFGLLWGACGSPNERPEPWTPARYSTGVVSSTDPESTEPEPGETPAYVPKNPRTQPGPATRAQNEETVLRREFAGRRVNRSFVGKAAYYHDSLAGNPTACGDRYLPTGFTAAHRTLPFGTILRVVHPSSGRDVFVRVNDRGPFGHRELVLDLSRAAADKVGLLRAGVMKVRVEVMELGNKRHGRCGRR